MKNIVIFLFTILLTLSACRKDDHLIEEGPTTGNSEITEQSNLSGLIVDVEGRAIEGAELILQNKLTTSDENGIYFFTDADISSKGSLVKIKKQGYIPQFRFVFNEPGKLSFLNFVLVPEIEIIKFSSTSGGTFTVQDKSKVKFLPNSILNQDSTLYAGEVTLTGYWYNPFDDKTLSTMPGDLRGINKYGQPVQLATQGMLSLNMYDNQGNELIVGDPVELSFYVGNQGVDVDGTGNMLFWSLNEVTGEWIEEESSTLVGDYFVGEVSHFSFWNCDYPYPLSFISGIITDNDGLPIQNTEIKIVEQNLLTCGFGTTNEVGYFEANVPAEIDLILSIMDCDDEVNIGPFIDGSQDLGLITVNINTINVTGELLDCNGQAVTNAYILIENEITSRVFFGDQNGNFTAQVTNCSDLEWTLTAYDPSNLIFSDEFLLDPTNTFLNLEKINFCNNLDFYFAIKYKEDYELMIEPSADELQVLLLDNNCLVISNHLENPSEKTYTLVYPLDPSLPRSILEQITILNGFQEFSFIDNLAIDFTEFGNELGDIIAGKLEIGEHKIDFRLPINQKEESAAILVTSWNDENKNGIQEIGEGLERDVSIFLEEVGNDSTHYESYCKIPFLLTYPDDNGIIQYIGLKGDKEFTLIYHDEFPTEPNFVSPSNQGTDDNIDSDFFWNQSSNNGFITDSFYLIPGQIEASYDLGTY